MELGALLMRQATEFIKSSRKDTSLSENQLFLNNMLGLGLRVVDDQGYSIGGSNLKSQINRMKNKYKVN